LACGVALLRRYAGYWNLVLLDTAFADIGALPRRVVVRLRVPGCTVDLPVLAYPFTRGARTWLRLPKALSPLMDALSERGVDALHACIDTGAAAASAAPVPEAEPAG